MAGAVSQKSWDPRIEDDVLGWWKKEGLFERPESDSYYTIDTPPPYPSGRPWHIGAAAHYAQIDMIARTARMEGRAVYFPMGIDRNGLPVELYTEKKHKVHMREVPRDEFLEMCRGALDELESEMVRIMRALGMSGELDGRYRTDTPEYRSMTQATFIRMWREGRIYLATRPNNYDWASGTTIADAEIAHRDMPSKLVGMRFEVEGSGPITIATTRPELLCACRAIIVNPDDDRYATMVGKRASVPVYGHMVRIRAHPSARPEFGSGAVMVCSYGDHNDVALFREMKLEEVASVGMDGRMTEAAGEYAGLRPKQARSAIIRDMEGAGLLEYVRDMTHRTPVSERSGVPIEIIPMDEYYLKQKDQIEHMRGLADSIQFHPPMHRQILDNWLDSITIDWPVSRRRYYGTEVPVWYCDACGEPHVPEPGPYYRPWREEYPGGRCGSCGAGKFTGETRTLDTWMDSSISPLFVAGYDRDPELFEKAYPAAVRPQSKDIVRTWLYYTLLRCGLLTGRAPWRKAWIMGYGLDERGLKMSKSRGNSIDPYPVIRRYGADAFRLWSASEVNLGYDFRCNEQKIGSMKKFLTKLWNVSRLLSGFPEERGAAPDLLPADSWILYELDVLVAKCREGYAAYNFFVPATAVREFTWNLFAAHYIEMVKRRARRDGFGERKGAAAVHTLHTVLSTVLRLLAPVTPFMTDYLWRALYSQESVHLQMLPEPRGLEPPAAGADEVAAFNSMVWNKKKAAGLSLKDSISVDIPDELLPMAPDLRAMHNIV